MTTMETGMTEPELTESDAPVIPPEIKDLYAQQVVYDVNVTRLGFRRWEVSITDNFGFINFTEVVTSREKAKALIYGQISSVEEML